MNGYFSDYFTQVKEAATWLERKVTPCPRVGLVLTGGLQPPLESMIRVQKIPVREIPHYPLSRARGHAGKLIFGNLDGKEVVILLGRAHYYEGHAPQTVVFPYFVLQALGLTSLISTNSAGGVSEAMQPGQVMLIKDQINAMGANPLRGIAIQENKDPFTDMTSCFYPPFLELAREAARSRGLALQEGIYLGTTGPSYETRAEIKAFRTLGADAVGMSTVFEVIACAFLKIRVLAFSLITNPAADLHPGGMAHEEVLEAAKRQGPDLIALIRACLKRIR